MIFGFPARYADIRLGIEKMAGLGYRIKTATAHWFIGLCLSLIVTACALSRPLPVEKQDIDRAYHYAVPPIDRDGWQTQSLGDAGIPLRPLAALVSRIRNFHWPFEPNWAIARKLLAWRRYQGKQLCGPLPFRQTDL